MSDPDSTLATGPHGPLIAAPISSPPVVHQAVGMTMEYLQCSASEAYDVLVDRAAATRQGIKFIAGDVVERRLRFGS